ncbi:hypothetical protein G6F55_003644 [Rhizopus delemar]|uniref:Velvet domain-containing protein n=2 Tax=Rhizopus TaxID=4842 RepID=A0A9P6YSZ3_9FUNG|nr:hypothetical protein G6F55_003644 [Rhizopus delemar]KAG1544028.1 hypothetical protein G6F51_006319 [Rhizopus arrhizus]KAG1489875.1 hypothetical protein G6F54_011130 [Rhizopus delemar]KAG1500578.1 hypothetical protein G6F53_011273 [Rhizopus delemar]KAG1507559.1 hypothetical protein G6F52_011603 [Rhizopus delemar]
MTNENDDFFDLINFSGEQEHVQDQKSPLQNQPVTFMEPNINNLLDFPINRLLEKYKRKQDANFMNEESIYLLQIVEQPEQCRVSGDSVKDRRPIDPAPIIKLSVFNSDLQRIEESTDNPFYVTHASLWSVDMNTQLDILHETRALIGSLVSSPSLLKDLDNQRSYFFAFSDLSVRLAGQYRLKFSLIHLTRNEIVAFIFSDPFTVYSAKTYPGMKESSELSKHLAKQGLKLTIRNKPNFKH